MPSISDSKTPTTFSYRRPCERIYEHVSEGHFALDFIKYWNLIKLKGKYHLILGYINLFRAVETYIGPSFTPQQFLPQQYTS